MVLKPIILRLPLMDDQFGKEEHKPKSTSISETPGLTGLQTRRVLQVRNGRFRNQLIGRAILIITRRASYQSAAYIYTVYIIYIYIAYTVLSYSTSIIYKSSSATLPTKPRKKRESAPLRQQLLHLSPYFVHKVYHSQHPFPQIPFATPYPTEDMCSSEMVESCDHEMFGVLAIFLGDNGTPSGSGDGMMETHHTEDITGLALCQRQEILALHLVHRNPIPRVWTTIGLVSKSLAWTEYRCRKGDMRKLRIALLRYTFKSTKYNSSSLNSEFSHHIHTSKYTFSLERGGKKGTIRAAVY